MGKKMVYLKNWKEWVSWNVEHERRGQIMDGLWVTWTELKFILRKDGGLEYDENNGDGEKGTDLGGVWI